MIKKLLKKIKKSKQGFTLIELIVVVAILGILAAVLIPTIGNQIKSAKTGALQSDASAAFLAAQMYANDNINTTNEIADTTTATVAPQLMIDSTYFKTIKGKNGFDASQFKYTAEGGAITSVTITDGNGTLTYPKDKAAS